MSKTTISESEFLTQFDTEASAVSYFERLRWPNGINCPYCDSMDIVDLPQRQHYHRCRKCNKQFTCKVGTVMQSSAIPVRMWLYTMYKMSVSRKGLSSLQLAKDIGVTQKSAWYMLYRLREACDLNGVILK